MQLDLNKYNQELSVQFLFSEVKTYLLEQGRSRVSKKKYCNALNVLVCNLLELQINDALIFSIANSFSVPERYNKGKVSQKVFRELIEALDSLGYIKLYLGKHNVSNTVIKPHRSFYEIYPYEPSYITGKSEYMILKEADKSLSDYKDDRYTRASRVILEAYNKKLHDTEVFLGDDKIHNEYYRIFNKDFTHGGRYYRAGVLALKSKDRLKLEIDEEPVVELDFSSMNVAILLANKGRELDYDPYSFTEERDTAKKILLTMISAESKESGRKAVQQAINKGEIVTDLAVNDLLNWAEAGNSQIRESFYSGRALNTMFQESEITTDIIATCLDLDIPVLCIHDGLVTQQKHVDILLRVMYDAFTGYFDNKITKVGVSIETQENKEKIVLTSEKKEYTLLGKRKYLT